MNGVIAGMMMSCATSVLAQVTYSVFPARVIDSVGQTQLQPAQHRRVNVIVQDSTVDYVVREVIHQAHLRLVHGPNYLPSQKRISVHLADVTAMDALKEIMKGTGFVPVLAADEETVIIRAQSSAVSQRSVAGGTIAGRVTDSASGQGLTGVIVKVMGTKLSMVTSASGNFTVKNVPAGTQVLAAKLFGYRPAERTVTVVDSEQTPVKIAMVPVANVLSGVVTTATGLQRKIEVGNDITSINVDSVMRTTPVTSVTDLLETRVPGLAVLHASGTPGDPARLRLRGASSVYGNNDPIVVVDGVRIYASQSDGRNNNLAPNGYSSTGSALGDVNNGSGAIAAPSPLDQIDPNTIETIEVFKGPSASAMYGSDAASGVIVITTKRGRAGPTDWNLAAGQGVNWLPGSWPTNYYRFGYDGTGYSSLRRNSGFAFCNWTQPQCSVDSVVTFQALNQPRFTTLAHGSDQTASLTVSGGVPTLQYSLSGNATGDRGNLKLPAITQQLYQQAYGPIPGWMKRPDNYQTWGVGGSLTALPSVTARVTLQSNLFSSTQQRSSLESALSQIDGEYVDSTILATASDPFIQNFVQRATSNQLTSTSALTLSWQPRAWLPLSATAGLNTIQKVDETYIPYGICYTGSPQGCDGSSAGDRLDTTGSYGLGRGTSHNQTVTMGTAIPLFRQHMTLSLGGNLNAESTADFTAYTNQLAPGVSVPTTFPTSGLASNRTAFGQSTSGQSTYGYYVEPRLNFASRFFVAPGFRLDGGSGGSHASYSGAGVTSGGIGGLSAFPKINLSYLAVDRPTGHPLWGVLTLLRPRLAFGFAGTQPAPADKLRLFNVGGYRLAVPGVDQPIAKVGGCLSTITLDGSTFVPGVCLNSLGNTGLRPERSSEFEGGVDATLWQGRLTVTYTQFNKTRHDAILPIPVAPSVSGPGFGGSTILKNIGVIRNTGTELTLNAFVLQRRTVSWNVGLTLSSDNNLVVRLNTGQAPLCFGTGQGGTCQGTQIVPGYPLFGTWALPIAAFVDTNHDGIIEPTEVRLADSSVYVGQPNPKNQLSFTNDLSVLSGRLSVHATVAYENGLTQNNQGALVSGAFTQLPNTPGTSLATQAAVGEANCGIWDSQSLRNVCHDGTQIGLIQTVNTLRFSSLSINYEIPRAVSGWFRVPRMTLALQGSNLGLHTNYRGVDPNVNAFSTVSAGDQTADTGQLPEPRTWWLKVNLSN